MKINIEKAVQITGTCLCCNTIQEIQKNWKTIIGKIIPIIV